MTRQFSEIAFTETVKRLQTEAGSRDSYARMTENSGDNNDLTDREAAFIGARDSFYMATIGETGWPYVQHRGGPIGFVRILDERTLGFADFRCNRQYVSVGNLSTDNRVSLFFMDYPNRRRLKIFGRVSIVGVDDDETMKKLSLGPYRARAERAILVNVEGFDWNCPQHITPRFTEAEMADQVAPLNARIAELEAELTRIRTST
ncbi:MAG: pyridoxamine 5-phosphate oxidase [Alphaproteobacteria bacterium]|nr:pyridoxamine 5-phosphate oxidase [Alphaproteobacteria bacterium]